MSLLKTNIQPFASKLHNTCDKLALLPTGALTGVKGQMHYTISSGAMLVAGDVNGDGIADFTIKVDGIGGLVAADFVL